MIIKRQWIDKKGHWSDSNGGIRTYIVEGYFLFGFLPLFINRNLQSYTR